MQFSTVGTAIGLGRPISQGVIEWARGRRVSQATLDRLGVASGTAFFPDIGEKAEAVFFKYRNGWKARSIKQKSFVSSKGFALSFWGEEEVLAGEMEIVYIVEGEMDRCALVEAGLPPDQVISVPNGAKERPADEPQEARGYSYAIDALKRGMSRVGRFVWCGDGDEAGRSLRSDMARILGAARFWFVEWPEGCKDANDVLRHEGPVFLHGLATEGSLPWPVDGLYRLDEVPEPPPLVVWQPGFPEWENKVRLAPRTLSVATGHPGHGKTILWGQIWFQVVKEYGVPACIASFETRPKPHLRRQLRTLFCGALERNLSDLQKATADKWINERYLFLVHPEQRPSLEWFLDTAEVAVVRHGARIIQVDPWNRLEAARERNESETDYIGRCLRNIHAFAHDLNCHVQIIAHPAKMHGDRRGHPPELEDISGSKHWDNMVDQGFVVYRPKIFDGTDRKTEAVLIHRKARFEELGYPCKLDLNFDLLRDKFVSTDYA